MANNIQGPNGPGMTLPTPVPHPAPSPKPAGAPAAGAPAQGADKAAAGKAAATGDSANAGANTQDRFLKLLVTQMKNQDPLNPMDNAQVTSQMAQLSTVSGIDKVNSTLKALSDSMAAGQSLTATGMIGHGALVPGSAMELRKGEAVAGVNLDQSVDKLKVSIKDGANNVVRTLQLGAQKPGVVPIAWDGKDDQGKEMADGSYKIAVEADADGKPAAASTLSFGVVNGIAPGTAGAQLDMGKLGMFKLSDIKQVM